MGTWGGLAGGLLRGFSNETARQEAIRRDEDSRQQGVAIDFWSNILSRGDLTPEGRQFVLQNIGQTMGQKPSRGFGGVRRGGKGKGQFDITNLISQAMDFEAQGPSQGQMPFGESGGTMMEVPGVKRGMFSDPEQMLRSELNIRNEAGIAGARGEAEAKLTIERGEVERRGKMIEQWQKEGKIDAATAQQMAALNLFGHTLPSQPRQAAGKKVGVYNDKFSYYNEILGLPPDEAHGRALGDIEKEDKATADQAALDLKLKQALLANRIDTGDDDLSPAAKMSNMRILRQQAMAQALTAEQNAMFDPRYRALDPDAQRRYLQQVRDETYRRAIAPLTPEEIDAAMLNLRDTGNTDALRERGPGDFADDMQ